MRRLLKTKEGTSSSSSRRRGRGNKGFARLHSTVPILSDKVSIGLFRKPNRGKYQTARNQFIGCCAQDPKKFSQKESSKIIYTKKGSCKKMIHSIYFKFLEIVLEEC